MLEPNSPIAALIQEVSYGRKAISIVFGAGLNASLAEVSRFSPRHPFDVAANTGLLGFGQGLTCNNLIQGSAQIRAVHRFVVARAAVIELTAIDQLEVAVK